MTRTSRWISARPADEWRNSLADLYPAQVSVLRDLGSSEGYTDETAGLPARDAVFIEISTQVHREAHPLSPSQTPLQSRFHRQNTMSYTELIASTPGLLDVGDSIKIIEVAKKYDQPKVSSHVLLRGTLISRVS